MFFKLTRTRLYVVDSRFKSSCRVPLRITGVWLNAFMASAFGSATRTHPKFGSLALTQPSLEFCQLYSIWASAVVKKATMVQSSKAPLFIIVKWISSDYEGRAKFNTVRSRKSVINSFPSHEQTPRLNFNLYRLGHNPRGRQTARSTPPPTSSHSLRRGCRHHLLPPTME